MLYADREEWRDITPLEQSDLENPLVPIFYPIEYKDAMDYFRGIVATKEHTDRVLELTEHIIRMNPAHYSVWQYRYSTLLALCSPEYLTKELDLMDELCLKFMKYYQVWSHRKLLLLLPESPSSTSGPNPLAHIIPTPSQELTYLSRVLATDAKNYHTWAYRQWVLTHYGDTHPGIWEYELIATDILIEDDVRNNSAWHHRFFICFASGAQNGVEERELAFVKSKISLSPNNLSAWNYLRGILDKLKIRYAELQTFVELYSGPRVGNRNEDEDEVEVYDLDNPRPSSNADLPCALAIEFLADIHEQEGDNEKAINLLTSLAEDHDTTRKRYWEYRARELLASKTK